MRSVDDVDMQSSTGYGGAVSDDSDNDEGIQRASVPTSIDDSDPCYLVDSDSKSAYELGEGGGNLDGVPDAVTAGTEDSDDDEGGRSSKAHTTGAWWFSENGAPAPTINLHYKQCVGLP